MNALKSIFTRKKPLSSSVPNTARNNFTFVNPSLINKTVQNKLNRYVATYKKMKTSNMEKVQKELQEYAQQNPRAKNGLKNRFNRRSYSNLSNLSNDQIANLRNELFEPGISTKRMLERIESAGFMGGKRNVSRKSHRTRRTRRNRRN